MNLNLKDHRLLEAISRIQARAERNEHDDDIAQIFVDRGWLATLQANKNQVVLGRRGTGKTHLLRALIALEYGADHVYIDCRRLRSAPLRDQPIDQQANSCFRAILDRVLEWALSEILRIENPGESPSKQASDAWALLGQMNANLGKGVRENLSQLSEVLEELIRNLNRPRLTIVLDEWVSIPMEVQPYVAELMKRVFFTSPKVACKIAAIEFQSRLRARFGDGWIGMEAGADVFADLDMDSYLIYDKDRDDVERFFAEVLFKHLKSEYLPLRAIAPHPVIDWVTSSFFSEIRPFRELVRAGEGVTRDFIQIFARAFTDQFFRHNGEKLDIARIRDTAAVWFRRDKQANIGEDQRLVEFLQAIVEEAIGKKKARTFLVEQRLVSHPLIQRLFDARMIHLVRRGYSSMSRPGVRFDIFRLDYGTYVHLIGTSNAPDMDMFGEIPKDENPTEFEVPFDDYRRIRRIIISQDLLARYSRE